VNAKNQDLGLILLNTFICAGIVIGSASAQRESPPSSRGESTPAKAGTKGVKGDKPASATSNVADDYVIGTEDVLAIVVWKDPEVSRTVPVRPDGKISLPLIGDLQASGRTPTELKNFIADGLKAYITNPEVAVIVQEVRSRKFNIVGQVSKPGTYALADKVTILDAIAAAGGFQQFAKPSKIYVLRRARDGSQLKLPFNYKEVINGKRSDQNVELMPEDTVVIP
jgi:polysaccharide export outer membrane protein